MSEKILVPVLGESITEATVAKWLKNKGDSIETDEPLVELETDKVNLEVPSPVDGILSEINANNGQVVEVGAILGLVTQNGEVKKTKKEIAQPKKKIEKSLEVDESSGPDLFNKNVIKLEKSAITKQNGEQPLVLNKEIKTKPKVIKTESSQTLSPAVRKIVEENKIDIKNIEGSGKDGRLTKGDVIRWMSIAPKPSERKVLYGQEERIKMTRLRMTIAKRLKQAQETAAMLTTFNEVDMQNVIQMRKDYQENFQKEYSVKLGFMSFFVKACVSALKNFPAINAEIQDGTIVYKNYYNISFAVGTDRGLVVPVLRSPDEMSFADIEKNIASLGEKAREGKISIENLQGGTFTITNGGIYGSMLSTPILNPPQSGVLGMHNIIERPVVKNKQIVIRPMMYLALSYDHRIVDGKEAVSFLKNVKESLEEPQRLFLNV